MFFWNSCIFNDPADVGNLISGSSAFSKTSLNIWKNVVHWRREWQTTSVSCLENPMNTMKRQNDRKLNWKLPESVQFSSLQSLSRVRLFVTPWTAAHQSSPFITNSQSSLKLMSIESVTPSNHLILCRPLLLLPPIPSSIRVFSNELTLRMR